MPEVKLLLLEKGDYLLFQPVFTYKGFETKANDKDTITVPEGDKILWFTATKKQKNDFIEKLQSLHSSLSATGWQ